MSWTELKRKTQRRTLENSCKISDLKKLRHPPLNQLLEALLRHALLPVVTILSLRIGWIVGGAVTIEFVFARPGLGSLLITSLAQRDYPVVQGCLLMLAMAVMLGTLLGDLVQAGMDPRVRDQLR